MPKVRELIEGTIWLAPANYETARPLITVMLPTFRRGTSGLFLRAAQSVLAQSEGSLELLIIDDASVDGTRLQIDRLMRIDERVGCLRHSRNVGLPVISLFEAFLKSKGEYFIFAFDDVEFEPTAIAALRANLDRVGGDIGHGHIELAVFDKHNESFLIIKEFGRRFGHSWPQSMYHGGNSVGQASFIVKRNIFERFGFLDPHLAVARVNDWDYWRRLSSYEKIWPFDILVGSEHGPATTNSLGETYQLDLWLANEWLRLERSAALSIERFPDYDVMEPHTDLSPMGRRRLEDISASFSNRWWAPKAVSQISRGQILVVTNDQTASVSSLFLHLPPDITGQVRVIGMGLYRPSALVGASAVIFVRNLYGYMHWIEWARACGIPTYWMTDNDFIDLWQNDPAVRGELAAIGASYELPDIRRIMRSFAGVLVTTEALRDRFVADGVHEHIGVWPPAATERQLIPKAFAMRPHTRSKTSYEAASSRKKFKDICIVYMADPGRISGLYDYVLPAVYALCERINVRFVCPNCITISPTDGLTVTFYEFEPSFDLLISELRRWEPDILVTPGITASFRNKEGKCPTGIFSAALLGCASVSADEPPYDRTKHREATLLCKATREDWLEKLHDISMDRDLRSTLIGKAQSVVRDHYFGQRNRETLRWILGRHPSPTLAVVEARLNAMLEYQESVGLARGGAGQLAALGRLYKKEASSIDPAGSAPVKVGSLFSSGDGDERSQREVHVLDCFGKSQSRLLDLSLQFFGTLTAMAELSKHARTLWNNLAIEHNATMHVNGPDLHAVRSQEVAANAPKGIIVGCIIGIASPCSSESSGTVVASVLDSQGTVVAAAEARMADIIPFVPIPLIFNRPILSSQQSTLRLCIAVSEVTQPVVLIQFGSRSNLDPTCVVLNRLYHALLYLPGED